MNRCQVIFAYTLLLGLLAAFCGFTAAIATNSWWQVKVNLKIIKIGLWQFCEEHTGKCFPFSQLAVADEKKLEVLRTLTSAAVVMCGLAVLTSCIAPFTRSMRRVFPTLIVMEACLAAFAGLFGIASTAVTILESQTIFEAAAENTKKYSYDWSFYLAGASSVLALCVFLLAIILLVYACALSRTACPGKKYLAPYELAPRSHPRCEENGQGCQMTRENIAKLNQVNEQRESLQLLRTWNLSRSNSGRSCSQVSRSQSRRGSKAGEPLLEERRVNSELLEPPNKPGGKDTPSFVTEPLNTGDTTFSKLATVANLRTKQHDYGTNLLMRQ